MRKEFIELCPALDAKAKGMNKAMSLMKALSEELEALAPSKETLNEMEAQTDACVPGRDRSARDVANSVDARDASSIAKETKMLHERLLLLKAADGPAALSKSANAQIKKFQKSLQQMLEVLTKLNGAALTMREVAVHANVASSSEITAIYTQLNALERMQTDETEANAALTAAQESEATVRQELSDVQEQRHTEVANFGVLLAARTAELADEREETLRLQRELADKESALANSFAAKARKALGSITNLVPRLNLV